MGTYLFPLFFLVFTLGTTVYSDVIDPNYHPVERCVTIEDLEVFPDIAIVGMYFGPTMEGSIVYQVKSDSCLTKGYKFNTLALFWVTNTYLSEVSIDELPVDQMKADIHSAAKKRILPLQEWGFITSEIEPYGGTVPDQSPLLSEELVYRLVKNSGEIAIVPVKKVSHFEDGTENVEYLHASAMQPAITRYKNPRFSVDATMGKGYLLITPSMSGKIEGTLFDCTGRTVVQFSRNGKAGSTYLLPVSAGSGIYWLQVYGTEEKTSVRIESFR